MTQPRKGKANGRKPCRLCRKRKVALGRLHLCVSCDSQLVNSSPPCLHCQRRRPYYRRRRLCLTCYRTPGIRDLYPRWWELDPLLTEAGPEVRAAGTLEEGRQGTPERVSELQRRLRDGLDLWR